MRGFAGVGFLFGTFVCESERCRQEATSAETEKCPSLDTEFGERVFHELG